MTDIFGGIGDWLITLLYSLPGILIGLVLHEFAHAATANALGDPTPKLMGRLTLNPIAHLDPIGTLMLFVARFGWAKPVITNPSKYKIKRFGFALVGLAGPMTNFVLAIIFFFTYLGLAYNYILPAENAIMMILINAAWINTALGIFNLLPIPPLDGYNIFKDIFLVKFVKSQALWNFERYGQFLLIAFIVGTSYLNINIVGSAVKFLFTQGERLYRILFL